MGPVTEIKKDRMQIRIDAHAKKIIERAAGYARKSVSEFVINHSLAAAERILEECEKITLPDDDWDALYEALVHPPEPNEALKTAYKKYRRVKGAAVESKK